MDANVLYGRLKEEFPKFVDVSDSYDYYLSRYCLSIAIRKWNNELEIDWPISKYLERELKKNTKMTTLDSEYEDYESLELNVNSLISNDVDILVSAIKAWEADMDALNKGKDEDVLIYVHPDVDKYSFPDLLKALKFAVPDDDFGGQLAILNLKDFDFNSDQFCEALNDNSGDCFMVWKDDEMYLHGSNVYEELKKLYPDIDKIRKTFDTDYD